MDDFNVHMVYVGPRSREALCTQLPSQPITTSEMEVNACLCINLILSTMFRFTTPYLRSYQLRSVGFLVGFLAGGKLLSSLQSSKPRHSRQLSEDNVPHSNQQGGSSHVKYFRIL